jgi:hypothetical protein
LIAAIEAWSFGLFLCDVALVERLRVEGELSLASQVSTRSESSIRMLS